MSLARLAPPVAPVQEDDAPRRDNPPGPAGFGTSRTRGNNAATSLADAARGSAYLAVGATSDRPGAFRGAQVPRAPDVASGITGQLTGDTRSDAPISVVGGAATLVVRRG